MVLAAAVLVLFLFLLEERSVWGHREFVTRAKYKMGGFLVWHSPTELEREKDCSEQCVSVTFEYVCVCRRVGMSTLLASFNSL